MGNQDSLWVEETKDWNLGPDAENLPLCEDLNPSTVGRGDSCWSTCQGQCPNDVLKPGLAFDFDEIKVGHPGCTSHYECVGNKDRVLCHAMRAVEETMPPWLPWLAELAHGTCVARTKQQPRPHSQRSRRNGTTAIASATDFL